MMLERADGRVAAKILVVDDQAANLVALKRVLEPANVDITTAASGNDALRHVLHSEFALILLDVMMPELDGFETASLIRSHEAGRDIPIIFVTAANAGERGVFAGYNAGAVDYMLKPIEPAILLAKVKVFLELYQKRQALERAHRRLQQEIVERRQIEHQLHRAQRLEALGRLAAGVGHEINNPLTYVMANLDFARAEITRLRGEGTSKTLDDLGQVLDETLLGAERIRRIVHDLRLFCSADSPASGPCDLHEVIRFAARIMANQLRARSRIAIECAEGLWVPAERNRLEQVFVNLLANAVQALPEGRASENEIRIIARREGNDRARIEVSDTGCGISAEDREHVFDAFFTTKTVGAGTGLGLSICHQIVTSVGGEIGITSEVGRGTTVSLSFPLASPPQAQEGATSPLATALAPRRRILVVDDEPLVLRAMQRSLADHHVVVTGSGREAIALCVAEDFDLVLCDLMMPDLTGMEVYDQVRQARPGVEARLVFMTGGAFTPAAEEFINRTSLICMHKPIARGELLRLVATCNALDTTSFP